MLLPTGYEVDRYRIVEKLGEGGMAVVYRVEHRTLGTSHALKVLTIPKQEVRDRLVMEGRVQATLRHSNVVAVSDVLDIGGSPGLLMEYIDGPAMDEWLDKYRPTLQEALTLFRGIVSGVGHAHSKGLIHRDLKPGNVMLAVSDEGVQPKVTDFGLAKVDSADFKRTRTGMTMGTPAYMAPEQIRDASSVDRRADLYSLGCILYELVCGHTPFDADDMLALFAAVATGKYPPAQEVNPEVPDAVAACIDGLIRVDPGTRLPDCAAILRVLDGAPAESFVPDDPKAPLDPPQSMGRVRDTVLPLSCSAADVARSMTRGVRPPDEISQVPWESRSQTSSEPPTGNVPRQPPPAQSSAPPTVGPRDYDTMAPGESGPPDPELAHVRPEPLATSVELESPRRRGGIFAVAGMAAVGGVVFVGGVGLVVVAALLFTSGDGDEAPDPTPTEQPEPQPEPRPEPQPTADPEPAPEPEPQPASEPEPAPARPDPVPVPTPPKPKPRPDATIAKPPPVPVAPTPPPVPEPAPEPVPEPEPAPPPRPAGGQFTFTGATRVELRSTTTGQSYGPGQDIPPGTYDAIVDGVRGGSKIRIVAGRTVALKCVSVMNLCQPN